MKYRSRCLFSLLAITMPATIVGAQSMSSTSTSTAATSDGTSNVRQGFFVSVGGGYGSAGINCEGCSTNRESGPVAYVRVGGTVNPHLRLGIESDGWAKTSFGVDEQIVFATADLYVYPSTATNFWIKGGFGLAAGKESNDVNELKATGAAVGAGIGYDWNVSGGNFVLVPFATYLRQLSGNIKANGADTGVSANADIFQFGIGLGYRH
jgi:hypothetical protein